MILDKPIPRAPVDELVVDSMLLHFSGQYAEVTVRAMAGGEQVGYPVALLVQDHETEVVRVSADGLGTKRLGVVKGAFTALADAKSAADVDALATSLGVFPGAAAEAKDAEQDAKDKPLIGDVAAVAAIAEEKGP